MKTVCFFAIAFSATALANDALTMADLAALDKQQSWSELLDNADRVHPADRTADWKRLVSSAAMHVVDRIAAAGDSDLHAAAKVIDVVPAAERKYGFLTSDTAYLDGKGRALSRVAAMCLHEDVGGCGTFIESLADGVQHFPKGTARSIALLLSDEKLPSETIHFWALAAADDVAACQDGRLEMAVVNVLRGDAGDRGVADAQRAAATCYTALEQTLVRELIASDETVKPTVPFLRNACPVLKTHGASTIAKKKKCP
jgi:hypothetical protein